MIINLDCLLGMRTCLADNSIDAVVTDPPYGLSKEPDMMEVMKHWMNGDDYVHTGGGFMGKSWDSFVPGPSIWKEVFRVLKPGGHLLAFFGSRTYDLGTLAIRLAGFEIRDQIMWVYSTGFPKSLNLNHLEGVKTCGCPKVEHGLRSLSERNISQTESTEKEQRQVLQQILSKQSSSSERRSEFSTTKNGSGKPSMERGCDNSKSEGQLRTSEVCKMPELVHSNVEKRRIHNGAPVGHGDMVRENTHTNRGSASHRPQPPKQRKVKSRTLAGQSNTQAVGAWENCPDCGKPMLQSGLGTALKPAHEPICVARKPLSGTVAENVLTHGTGALNIDGCRINPGDEVPGGGNGKAHNGGRFGSHETNGERPKVEPHNLGRWPANLIHDGSEEVLAAFPDAKGQQGQSNDSQRSKNNVYGAPSDNGKTYTPRIDTDTSAARFFYCAKASKSDRDDGVMLAATPAAEMVDREADSAGMNSPRAGAGRTSGARNDHPTVKPTVLMQWLVRLVTPPGGTVLDPFTGSGSTGKACMQEGFEFIGFEMDPHYCEIAEQRIAKART